MKLALVTHTPLPNSFHLGDVRLIGTVVDLSSEDRMRKCVGERIEKYKSLHRGSARYVTLKYLCLTSTVGKAEVQTE